MDTLSLTIDLTNKVTKLDVIHSFEKDLDITFSELGSWDAFYDNLKSLDTESEVIKKEKPKSLHLILKNIGDFEQACRDRTTAEYNTLIELLVAATDKKQRYDGINFTFEIAND